MRRGIIVLLGLVVAGIFANGALAAWTDPGGGWVKVCKYSAAAPNAVTGPFSFAIHDGAGTQTVSVSVGLCSDPIPVVPGTVTVTEASAPWYKVTSITALPGSTYLTGTNTTTQVATLNVAASADQSGTAVVNYTDQLVTGVIEICKNAATGSGLTGTYNYAVTGADGFSGTTSSVLGSCSLPMTVPAGSVSIQEQTPGSLYVTSITATSNGTNEIQSGTNVGGGLAVVGVNAGDASVQTLVTYTNDVTTLEVCKAWDSRAVNPVAAYGFTFTASGAPGVTGPAPLTSASIPAGTDAAPNCITVGQYRPGTTVTITEGIYPGTKVDNITVNPTGNTVPGSLSLPNRTVTVDLTGQPTTGGDTVVTFYDDPATPGTFKICKYAGTTPGPPIGTSFTFMYGPTGATPATVVVPLGGCSQPVSVPFNTTLNVSEVIGAGNAVSGIAVAPTFLTVSGALTTIPVVSAMNVAAGTVSVTIGENVLTEVDYTDVDPPITTGPTGGSTGSTTTGNTTGTTGNTTGTTGNTAGNTTGSNGGDGTQGSTGGTTSNNSTTSNSTSTGSTPAISVAAAGTGLSAVGSTSTSTKSTSAQLAKALKLSKLRKELKALKTSARNLNVKLHMTAKHSKQHKKLASQITNLKAREAKISGEIALLVK